MERLLPVCSYHSLFSLCRRSPFFYIFRALEGFGVLSFLPTPTTSPAVLTDLPDMVGDDYICLSLTRSYQCRNRFIGTAILLYLSLLLFSWYITYFSSSSLFFHSIFYFWFYVQPKIYEWRIEIYVAQKLNPTDRETYTWYWGGGPTLDFSSQILSNDPHWCKNQKNFLNLFIGFFKFSLSFRKS